MSRLGRLPHPAFRGCALSLVKSLFKRIGSANSRQFAQERFRGSKIGSVKAFAESCVNSCEQVAGVVDSSLVTS
jgi:hypothetical protein